jgi:hypothetical protein
MRPTSAHDHVVTFHFNQVRFKVKLPAKIECTLIIRVDELRAHVNDVAISVDGFDTASRTGIPLDNNHLVGGLLENMRGCQSGHTCADYDYFSFWHW